MLTGHNYIFFLSGKYTDCDFPVSRATYRPGTIISKPAGIPCTDPGYPHPFLCAWCSQRFWISRFLHSCSFCFFFPDIFPCISRYSNTITSAWFSSAYLTIAPAIFLPKLCVQTFRICPSSLCLRRAMFPLESADPSQRTVHPVFFTGMLINFLPRTVPSARMMVQTASVLMPKSTLQMICSFTGVLVSVTSSV